MSPITARLSNCLKWDIKDINSMFVYTESNHTFVNLDLSKYVIVYE